MASWWFCMSGSWHSCWGLRQLPGCRCRWVGPPSCCLRAPVCPSAYLPARPLARLLARLHACPTAFLPALFSCPPACLPACMPSCLHASTRTYTYLLVYAQLCVTFTLGQTHHHIVSEGQLHQQGTTACLPPKQEQPGESLLTPESRTSGALLPWWVIPSSTSSAGAAAEESHSPSLFSMCLPQVGDMTLAQLRALRWPGGGDSILTVEEAVAITSPLVSSVILDVKTYQDQVGAWWVPILLRSQARMLHFESRQFLSPVRCRRPVGFMFGETLLYLGPSHQVYRVCAHRVATVSRPACAALGGVCFKDGLFLVVQRCHNMVWLAWHRESSMTALMGALCPARFLQCLSGHDTFEDRSAQSCVQTNHQCYACAHVMYISQYNALRSPVKGHMCTA